MPIKLTCRGGHGVAEPQRAPTEDFAGRESQVAEFDTFLTAVETFTREMSEAAAKFAAAPDALLREVEASRGKRGAPAAWGQLVPQLTAQLKRCATGMHEGQKHLQAVQYLIEQSRGHSAEVHDAIAAREAAWVPKMHCDERAAELRRRFGPNLLLAEKRARLQAKTAADKEYQRLTDEAARAVEDMLSRRWAIAAAILWEACRFYTTVLGDAQKMLNGFSEVADLLVPPQSTESQLVPADSVIASFPAVREWLEKAGNVAAAVTGVGRIAANTGKGTDNMSTVALQLPPRRQPACLEPPPSLPPLRALAAGSASAPVLPAAALMAPSRPEGSANPTISAPLVPYVEGDAVQVWSSSAQEWLEAVVEKVFDAPSIVHGYWVPEGALKVSHQVGAKYIRPEHAGNVLRKKDSH